MQDVFIGTVRELLPLLGLVAIVLLVPALVLIYLFGRNPSSPIRSVYGFIQGGALWFALGIALIATIGSLFYSEILGFTPCLYCWYQRILMYPLVFIFATALVFKARDVAIYALPLSGVGAVFAFYHYLTQIFGLPTSCVAPGGAIEGLDCAERFIFHFGFITIPFLAFTAFLIIVLLSLFVLRKRNG